MVAALTLKEREYEPVIFEKDTSLGGQLNVADKPILKEKLAAYKNSLITRIERAGIEVRLNTAATIENVKELDPAGVFIATGGTPIIPNLPGVDRANVMTAEEVLLGKKVPTGSVIVVGGGVTGMETAETLASKGHTVTLVEMTNEIGTGLYRSVLVDYMIRFGKFGINVMKGEAVVEITENGAKLKNTDTAEIQELAGDTIVLALGVRPNETLTQEFEEAFDEVIVLGDANKSGRIAEATFDGNGRASTF